MFLDGLFMCGAIVWMVLLQTMTNILAKICVHTPLYIYSSSLATSHNVHHQPHHKHCSIHWLGEMDIFQNDQQGDSKTRCSVELIRSELFITLNFEQWC